MSQTTSSGVLGPKYWSYMAHMMAICLDSIITSRRVHAGDIPKGVLNDAKDLFQLVNQALQNRPAENPPAILNAYVVAANAVKGSSDLVKTTEELETKLQKYKDFIQELEKPHTLRKEEIHIAEQLKKFFLRLNYDGEEEAYERSFDQINLPGNFVRQ